MSDAKEIMIGLEELQKEFEKNPDKAVEFLYKIGAINHNEVRRYKLKKISKLYE